MKTVDKVIDFYADPDNYESDEDGFTIVELDAGNMARGMLSRHTFVNQDEAKILSFYANDWLYKSNRYFLDRGECAREYQRGE